MCETINKYIKIAFNVFSVIPSTRCANTEENSLSLLGCSNEDGHLSMIYLSYLLLTNVILLFYLIIQMLRMLCHVLDTRFL